MSPVGTWHGRICNSLPRASSVLPHLVLLTEAAELSTCQLLGCYCKSPVSCFFSLKSQLPESGDFERGLIDLSLKKSQFLPLTAAETSLKM